MSGETEAMQLAFGGQPVVLLVRHELNSSKPHAVCPHRLAAHESVAQKGCTVTSTTVASADSFITWL